MTTCAGANAFGWRCYLVDPPPAELRGVLLQFHYDGGPVHLGTMRPVSAAKASRLWWRLTGIARERLEAVREPRPQAQQINGEPVLLPAGAVMGAEMIAPEQRNRMRGGRV